MDIMSHTEQFYITMPESHPTANEGKRVAPNEGNFPVDATVNVFTEDDHILTFRMFKKGPFEKEYLIALVDAKPPITERPIDEKEIYVMDDIIVQGREFHLGAAFPLMSRSAFVAMNIFANVEKIVIPLNDDEIIE
jgi:hypothetical protein